MDNETKEMIKSFVIESLDSLDLVEPLIENINDPNDKENINSVFRVFHTIKGLSLFFGLNNLNSLTHKAETLLDILRKNPSLIDDNIISLIYSTLDLIREILILVSNEFSDEKETNDVENMLFLLDDAIRSLQTSIGENPREIIQNEFIPNDSDAEIINSVDEGDNSGNKIDDSSIQQLDSNNLISQEMIESYLSDTKDYLDNIDNMLIQLEKDPNNYELISNIFGMIHSIKGNSGFMGYGEIQDIAMETETILDSIRKNELFVESNIISILLSNTEAIRKRINQISEKINQSSNLALEEEQLSPQAPTAQIPQQKIEKQTNVETQTQEQIDSAKNQNNTPKLDIRVDTTKIDKLFDLVGELITTGNMITNNPDLAELQLPNFSKAASQLNKITRELQEITMSVRMMPLNGLFNKMKRLVRDTSLKLGKKANLIMSGQETEMDKNIIEQISDPLMHLVRNALDHGIETPEERIAKGKPETGTIHLAARYDGNEILITVSDDGAGMNPDIIKKKAIERGIIDPNESNISDKDIIQLIFEPGFSTAKVVTDISGRGVGLDVVKKNIEKLQGSVDVSSKVNEGTTFTLRIPLTLAIMDALLIKVGDTVFALPLLNVIETFKTDSQTITKTMDGVEMIKIQDKLLPFIRLYDIFKIEPKYYNIEQGLVLLIQGKNEQCCFFVDELLGNQQIVIKGFSDYIGNVRGLTGCMILNDGNIGLIIDIENTLKLFENPFTIANEIIS
ncbi:MAG TPA: chemotaxis protein CheA [Candidatus Kapabacteria bacterium]|nr:chemotaxis protein CheA [Candidatus Kapabacteria bacterium]